MLCCSWGKGGGALLRRHLARPHLHHSVCLVHGCGLQLVAEAQQHQGDSTLLLGTPQADAQKKSVPMLSRALSGPIMFFG